MFNLPNLFALRAKNNFNLKLFSKGVQIKSIVSSKDVIRAMIYLTKKKFSKETFNVISEHLSVRKIGEICKKYSNKIKLILTNDKIPYKGYLMNCSKIKKTGFKFKYKYKSFAKNYIVGN